MHMTSALALRVVFFYLPLAVAAGACLYHLAVTFASLRFSAQKDIATDFAPSVSVLKPVRGTERLFYETLRGYFTQDYPNFEIVFGIDDAKDSANWTIAQLRRDFPNVPVKVVVVQEVSALNPKINKLQHMVEEASHDVLVISDADIRVPSNYLRSVVQPLASERVGMVTCLYRAAALPFFSSTIEALGISADFAGQVLLARALSGVHFGLGATMATRKKQIAEIGGLAPWADYLADDYILGNRISAMGYGIVLSHTVVETLLPHRTISETFQQQLRWARTIRACSPRGYPGLLFAFGAPLALIAVVFDPISTLAISVLCAALLARWIAAGAAGALVCGDRLVLKTFWLLPLRDLIALAIWLVSFLGNEVVWRRNRFRLEANGKLRSIH